VAHRPDRTGLILTRANAVALERFQDFLDVEAFHAHAAMVDGRSTGRRRTRRRGRTSAGPEDEVHTRTDAKQRRRRTLPSADGEAEELLKESLGAGAVRHENREVTHIAQSQQALLR
jgi:hypothetical protein